MHTIPELSATQRKALKSQAHALKPVIRIGQKGVTDAVIRETGLALEAHELIKVHLAIDDRRQRLASANHLAAQCQAALVQSIGKICILYRQKRPTEDT